MGVIRAKFDEPTANWLKVLVDLHDRWFGEFKYRWYPTEKRAIRGVFETKGSRILKNAMNKIKNGQDKGKWIPANVRALPWTNIGGSTDFLNKSSIAKANGTVNRGALTYWSKEFQRPPTTWKEKYQHRQEKILQHSIEEDTSTQDSLNIATFVNDNEIYLNVVEGNMYGLGTLSKRFSCSKSAPSTYIARVKDQIEEMRDNY
ncbi:hypothetical protein HKD37_05G013176 [Glycine soja]